jgi:hypothetical protein
MAPTSGGQILVLLLLAAAHCFAQEILHAPESTAVFLNQSAVFTCETRGGITSWRINGTQREILLRDLVVSEESTTPEGTAVETLTIQARPQYNGTRVQCVTGLFGVSFVESDNATLTIQGPLSAVGGLKVDAKNASSVTISWSAPFSLDVTGVDPDIWYSVLIYNVTDENNPTAILCTDCINITETHYTFTPDYLSLCHVYNFSVIPLNGAGQGESSPNITDATKVEVESLNDSYCEVRFTHEQVHTVSVYKDTVRFVANNCTNGTVFTLPADGDYNATIDDPMICETGKTKNFTTYDVQEPHAESNDGKRIVVNGTLIGNSPAKGCFVVIQCNFSTQITFIALKRNGTNQNLSMAISMPASNYTVYVHDLEKDGLPNIHPANLVPSSVEIVHGEEKYKANDENMNNASISRNGSIFKVTCTPDEQSVSCILVYRAHGNYMLNCNETFPVTVDLRTGVNYTFALFRRLNNNTDERPFLSMFVQGTEDPSQPQPSSTTGIRDGGERAKTTSLVVAITVGVLAPLIILLVAVIIIAIMLRKRKSVELVVSIDGRKASNTALLVGRVAEDSGMKKEESKYEESKYAVVLTSVSVSRPSLPDVSRVQYQEIDIKTTHRMARSQYADLGPLPTNQPKPLEMDTRTQCPYVTVLPHATTPVNDSGNRGPPTVESVMSLLWGVRGRWKEIAEGLEFDEDLIDEIDTNNDTDEGCLQVCVEMWVTKLQPSWEKLSHVLKELGEVELARQAGNREPQEQWQVQRRQTSDSSSSGVVADASSDFSGEMVLGVEKTVAPDDVNNEDGTRGGKKMMPNDCSSGEQGARSAFFAYPALHEEALTVSESCEEDEDTKCDVVTVESEEREKVTIVSGTYLFDFPYKPSLEECHMLSPLEGNDDPDFAQDPVSTQGSDDDYHSESISSGRQISAAASDTAKVVGRDVIPGGVVVVAQQSTGFSGITGPEETDTTRGPFRQPAKEVVNDSLSLCVSESQQCAGRFGLNNAVYPSLGFLTGAGMLVIGGPYTRRDIFKTVPLEPPPEPEENQSQPSPEETDSSQPLPPDPTPPQSQLPEVSPLQVQENNPPTPPPPPPPLQSSEIEEKVSTPLKKRQYLDPPGNYQEKILKWLHTGVSRGFTMGRIFSLNSALGAPYWVELPSSAVVK